MTHSAKQPSITSRVLGILAVVAILLIAYQAAAQTIFADDNPAGTDHASSPQTQPSEQVQALISETESIRELVWNDLHGNLSDASIVDQQTTFFNFARSLLALDLTAPYELLEQSLGAIDDEALLKRFPKSRAYVLEQLLERGQYREAFIVGGKTTSKASQLMAVTNRAIAAGDFAAAERLLTDTSLSPTPELKGNFRTAVLLGNARLAMAAHFVGQEKWVEPALKRFRAVMQDKRQPSDDPIDSDSQWIDADNNFAGYFVLTLATCGYGEFAEAAWERLIPNVDTKSKSPWNWNGSTAANLCARLAYAGDYERAIAASKRFFDGEVHETVLHAICLHAAQQQDQPTLDRYANEYLYRISNLSFAYWPPREFANPKIAVSTAVKNLHRLGQASSHLTQFIQDMDALEQVAARDQAARLYQTMARKYRNDFETQLTLADVHGLRRFQKRFPYPIDPVVGKVPPQAFQDFDARQLQFLQRNRMLIDRLSSTTFGNEVDRHFVSVSRAGRVPKPHLLRQVRIENLREMIDHLIELDKREEAKQVFDALVGRVLETDSLSYVSGSAAGRVVNGATQHRYLAIQAAAQLKDVDSVTKIAERIPHRGPRIDAYRVFAKSYSQATDTETGLSWARNLEDPAYRFAATVGVLTAMLDSLDTESPTEIQRYLDRIDRYGTVFVLWGC